MQPWARVREAEEDKELEGDLTGIESMAEVLEVLGGPVSLRLDAGAFHARVLESLAEQLDQLYEDPEEALFDIEVRIVPNRDPRKISLSVLASSPDFDTTIRLYAYQLNSEELGVVLNALCDEKRKLEAAKEGRRAKVIIRKKADNSYDLHTAAQKLGVSAEWFKKMIPCTGYRSSESSDGDTVQEFRYRKDLVERLCKMKDEAAAAADLKHLADACCEGDLDWARDIVESINSKGRKLDFS
jgi:hypothetical protein